MGANNEMGTKRKTLSDAKAELNNFSDRRGKVVQNLKISLDDYNNKKEEAQEAVQDVAEVDLEELERELAEREKALEESKEEKRVLMEDYKQKKDDYVEKKAALDSFIDAQTGLQG